VLGTSMQGDCPTPGCTGIGHVKGSKYTGHHRYWSSQVITVQVFLGSIICQQLVF